MSIPLKSGRRRRSYADYKPPGSRGPRNDPFRIIVYLVLIAAGIWAYTRQDMLRSELDSLLASTGGDAPAAGDRAADGRAPLEGSEDAESGSSGSLAAQAEAAYSEGQLTTAIDLYREAIEEDPETAAYYVEVARLLIYEAAVQYGETQQEMLREALDAANNAVLVDPFDPAGYAVMGKVYDWQARPDQATSTILQALDIDGDYALAHSYLAEAYVDLDRWEQAQESIEVALSLQPDHVDIRRDYGYVLETLGDYAGAATQYEAALRLHPRIAYLHVSLARIYAAQSRYDEALDRLFDAQLVNPGNALLAYEIGRTYETYIGDAASALEYYERAVERDPGFGRPWQRIGSLRYFEGRYAEAIVAFERAIALEAVPDALYYQIGLAYAYEGRCDTATRYLEEAQTLAEGDERVLEAVQAGFDTCAGEITPGAEETPEATDEADGDDGEA